MGDVSASKYIWTHSRKASADKLQATGHTSHLHTRLGAPQPKPRSCQDYHSDLQLRRATFAKNRGIRIPLSEDSDLGSGGGGGGVVTSTGAPRVNLELEKEYDYQPSPRAREPKPPSIRIGKPPLPTPPCHSTMVAGTALSLSDSHGDSIRLPRVKTTPFNRSAFQRLVSESPDYMVVGAKFTEGHLILTDEEGVVLQRLTESESEANFDSRTLSSKAALFRPSTLTTSTEHVTPPKGSGSLASKQGVVSCSGVELGARGGGFSDEEEEEDEFEMDGMTMKQFPVPPGIRAPPTSAAAEMRD